MSAYSVLVWVHVVLFVYWLGADIGVFIGAIWVKNAKRSFVERAALLQLATAIDMTPRLAFILMMPLGLTMARHWGLPLGDAGLAAVWAVAALWLASAITIMRSHGTPLARSLERVQNIFMPIAGVTFIAAGIYLLNDGTVVPAWLAWKIILFGGIFFLAIGIGLGFGPLGPAFGRLAAEGSTPEIESAIRRPIDITLIVVSALYLVLLAISFLGVVKPDL
jgi:hypothetical protein